MGQLTGKIAIVTGASYGLGRGIALALAREGCRVALAARTPDKLNGVSAEIAAAGGEALAVPCDVGDEAQVAALFKRTIDQWGRLDLLVNNAAILDGAPLESFPLELWQRALLVNLTGPFLCTREAFRIMKPQRGGRIVNIASVAARRVRPDTASYAATKHALWGLTQVAALEGRDHGIACSCLMPGNIRTEARATPDSDFNREPMMTIDEVAAAVVFVAAQPPHLNVLEMTMLPNGQMYVGRG